MKSARRPKTTVPQLTANDLKVRGKDRFVVIDVAQHHDLREFELQAALAQSRADVAAGHAVTETAAEHLQRMERLLADDAAN
jgi:hypothetical protein